MVLFKKKKKILIWSWFSSLQKLLKCMLSCIMSRKSLPHSFKSKDWLILYSESLCLLLKWLTCRNFYMPKYFSFCRVTCIVLEKFNSFVENTILCAVAYKGRIKGNAFHHMKSLLSDTFKTVFFFIILQFYLSDFCETEIVAVLLLWM